jgi:hypothetical protein
LGSLAAITPVLIAAQDVDADSINFQSVVSATVAFDGSGHFVFRNSDGTDTGATGSSRDFAVSSTGGVFASLIGLQGNITGTFTIGAIASCGPSCQTAPVTGSGGFSINDGAGSTFTSDLSWVDIATFGTGGLINTSGVVNVSSFLYSGLNADLLALAAFPAGTVTASFQFAPAKSLSALTTASAADTSYSGTLTPSDFGGPTAVPEPITMFLGGTGLLLLGYAARRRLFG